MNSRQGIFIWLYFFGLQSCFKWNPDGNSDFVGMSRRGTWSARGIATSHLTAIPCPGSQVAREMRLTIRNVKQAGRSCRCRIKHWVQISRTRNFYQPDWSPVLVLVSSGFLFSSISSDGVAGEKKTSASNPCASQPCPSLSAGEIFVSWQVTPNWVPYCHANQQVET